jgi:hypothetical protein
MAYRRGFMSGMRHGTICAAIWLACGVSPGLARQAPVAPHAPAHHHHVRARRHRHAAPIPPPPPPQAPAPQETAAPLPNLAAEPPHEELQPGLNVVPGDLQLHFPPAGDGYPPASSSQALDDSHTPKVPGLTLTVPLGQPGQDAPPEATTDN